MLPCVVGLIAQMEAWVRYVRNINQTIGGAHTSRMRALFDWIDSANVDFMHCPHHVEAPVLSKKQKGVSVSVAAVITVFGKSPLCFLPKNRKKDDIYKAYKTTLTPHIQKKYKRS